MTTFIDMGIDPHVLKSLEKMGFTAPTPIQGEVIPHILNKHDVIALAETGSGKTAACAIPICHAANTVSPHIQSLVIVPTRELALQYATEAQRIGREKGVKVFAIYGGEDAGMQQSKLASGVQVLIATPGRLIDFIYSRQIDLTHVTTLILDEADEMLSMGFYDDLEFIIQCLIHEHQTLLFSATMPKEIVSLAKAHMKSPKEITLITENATPKQIDHYFVHCRAHDRDHALLKVMSDMKPKQAIIFCHSRIQCEKVCSALRRSLSGVDLLHGGLSQDVRTIVTNKFRTGRVRFLVATNVAARGLDFSSVTHVFIYQLSDDPDVYVHRSGRTGRVNRAGIVVTLVTDREMKDFHAIIKKINLTPQWIGPPPPARSSRPRPPRPRS